MGQEHRGTRRQAPNAPSGHRQPTVLPVFQAAGLAADVAADVAASTEFTECDAAELYLR